MGKRIAFVGAGALGGYVGGHLTRAGHDVTLIDPWPAHVERMRSHGIELTGTTAAERHTVRVNPMHVTDVQSLVKQKPIDIAFVAVKSYDTEWATLMIRPYLAPDGFVVSLQNCINEERIAQHVGWGRTVGCIASLIAVELYEPGRVKRTVPLGGDRHTVFRVGEPHGRVTRRIEEVAELLRAVDSAKITTNLWGERWSKLVVNSMRNGLSAATGLVLSTYTGVLIGATAIPVWSRNVSLLPLHFGASGVGAAVSMLELMGHRDRALNRLGIGAAAIETAIALSIESRTDPVLEPLKQGASGGVTRLGGVLAGPIPLALRVIGGRSRHVRTLAAVSTIAGSLLTRIGRLAAGRTSAATPSAPGE